MSKDEMKNLKTELDEKIELFEEFNKKLSESEERLFYQNRRINDLIEKGTMDGDMEFVGLLEEKLSGEIKFVEMLNDIVTDMKRDIKTLESRIEDIKMEKREVN